MAIYVNTNEVGKIYVGNSEVDKIYDHKGALIHSSIQYLVGSETNNTVQSSYSGTAANNWYGDPVRCGGVWAFDASGWNTLHVDIKGPYTWYTNPDNASYHVNSLCRFGYSTSNKNVGTNYNASTFAAKAQTNGSRKTYTFDITNVDGTVYFWVGTVCAGGGISTYFQLYNVWLT